MKNVKDEFTPDMDKELLWYGKTWGDWSKITTCFADSFPNESYHPEHELRDRFAKLFIKEMKLNSSIFTDDMDSLLLSFKSPAKWVHQRDIFNVEFRTRFSEECLKVRYNFLIESELDKKADYKINDDMFIPWLKAFNKQRLLDEYIRIYSFFTPEIDDSLLWMASTWRDLDRAISVTRSDFYRSRYKTGTNDLSVELVKERYKFLRGQQDEY